MLNSAEHEILNTHKCKHIKKFSCFSDSDKLRMLFFLNVKMTTIVGILTLMSRKNFMLTRVEHEKSFITSGPGIVGLLYTRNPYSSCFIDFGMFLSTFLPKSTNLAYTFSL